MSSRGKNTTVSSHRSTRGSVPVVLAYRSLHSGNKWDEKLTSYQVDELCQWFKKIEGWRKNWFGLIYTPYDVVTKEEVYLLDCLRLGLDYKYVLYIAKGCSPSETG